MPRPFNPNTYHGWRKLVFIKDGYKCVECGSEEKLEAHHIQPYSKNHSLKYDVRNGSTFCHDCHKKTDSYGSRVRRSK